MRRDEVEEVGTLMVLGVLGLLGYAKWAITGRPDWARARTSYPT